ncbi:efflux RND transporter periplasmic adaptor subunit [soil metagenome]
MRHFLLAGLLACVLFSCKEKKETPAGGGKPAGPPPVFEAVIAASFALNRNIETPGTILPNESTDIHSEISGRVIAINFKEGSFIQKGALLIKLFDSDLMAQLNKLQVQLQIAQTTSGRQKELLAINGTSQQDYDNASLLVSNTQADIELLKVNIGRTQIRAPFSGRIGLRNISLGAYVTPATLITNIAQVNMLKAEFSVPEKYAPEMSPGRLVQLHADGSSKSYTASIIASQNTIASETRNLTVRALVKNPDNQLRPGAFVQVKIAIGDNAPAIMIPTQAVIPSTRYKKVIVARAGKAVFQNINTGFRDSSRVEVLDGIMNGDTIIINGLLTIKEGMPLKVAVKKQ